MLTPSKFRRAALNAALYYARENRLERQGGGGDVPLPDPTTVNFTGTQMLAGFTGSVSTTKTAGRIYTRAELTVWSGYISGTEAKLTFTSDFGDFDGGLDVAIDGGAFAAAPRSGQVYTLFTGLTHAKHLVEFRVHVGLGDAAYLVAANNSLEVTGQPPTLQLLSNKIEPGADSALGIYSGAVIANSATYTPALQATAGTTYGSNVGSVKIKGAFTKLVITLNGLRSVGVSKNGGAATYYTIAEEDTLPTRVLVIPCDGSTATYNVWDDGNGRNLGGAFCVAADSAFLDIGTRRRLDQYGDSITAGSGGGPSSTSGDVETMRVASALGFVGSTNGVNGLTIVGCKTLLDTVLPLRTVAATDVAILAIGGNVAADGIDATEQADYGLCIDKLLAKGYAKVLCRGILPVSGAESLIATANAALKSVMDGKADAKLVWIDPVTWTGYATSDGTHPTAAGYVTISGFAITAYTAALGL